MTDDIQVSESVTDNESDSDFGSLINARRMREKIQSDEWTEIQIIGTSVYEGYEFAKSDLVQTSSSNDQSVKFGVMGVPYDGEPEDAISDILDGKHSFYETPQPNFEDIEGSVVYDSKRYYYRKRKWVVVEVASHDRSYKDQILITGGLSSDPDDNIFQNISSNISDIGSIGYAREVQKRVLRIGYNAPQTTLQSYLDATRGAILFIGLISSSILLALYFSLTVPSILAGMFVLTVGMLLSALLIHRSHKNWYEVSEIDWTDRLDESARVESQSEFDISEDILEFRNTEAKVTVDNATLTFETDFAKWVIESEEEGVPSQTAERIYEKYNEIEFTDVDEITVQVAKMTDATKKLGSEYILSEDKSFVMKI